MTAVTARQLCKQVSSGDEPLTILDDVSLQVAQGESVAVVGASGSGKTTLLSLLAGLDLPTSGEILLAGQSLSGLDEDQRAGLRAGRVGFVFQSFQLLGGFTALENVMLPVELAAAAALRGPAQRGSSVATRRLAWFTRRAGDARQAGRADAAARARTVLEQVGLSARLQHYPAQLSGGEQQRVAIARAFAAEPQILFADEPTGNLDSATGARIIDLLFELNRAHGTTLVLVTHDDALASRCSRVLTLKNGRLQ